MVNSALNPTLTVDFLEGGLSPLLFAIAGRLLKGKHPYNFTWLIGCFLVHLRNAKMAVESVTGENSLSHEDLFWDLFAFYIISWALTMVGGEKKTYKIGGAWTIISNFVKLIANLSLEFYFWGYMATGLYLYLG